MLVKNKGKAIDFYINKRWFDFKENESKEYEPKTVEEIMKKFPFRFTRVEKKIVKKTIEIKKRKKRR